MVEGSPPSKLLSSAISLITLSRPSHPRDPPVHSHYPAAVTTIIIFLLAQPRTVMAGQRSWKKFPPFAFSKIHALCIFTVYRRYPRPLLGTALRANTLYTRHNSQLFSIVRTGICGNGFSLWFFLREFFNISYNLLKGTIDRNIVLSIRVSFFLFLNLTKDEGRLRKILLYYNMTCNSCNVIMTRNINSIKSLKTFYVIYVHM